MIIGIDARFFGPKAKGLGRYTQKLIEGLESLDNQNDYVIFLRRENFEEYQPQNSHFKKVLADYQWYSLSEQLFFPWLVLRQKIDLMHFTHFNAPILYLKPFVVTIHDLILQKFPTAKNTLLARWKYFFKNIGYKVVIRLVLARAKKIIAVSRFVKEDIVRSLGVAEERVSVIYEGAPILAESKGQIANSEEILKKHKIKKPYLLYVGNAYPHKNLARLFDAFKMLREQNCAGLSLVLVGGEDYFYKKLQQENCNAAGICFGGGVIFTGFVPDNELAVFYQNARAYVFPSLCEGFGLPPLEAMAGGAPVVASRATCLPEILGQAAHYFDGQNPVDMAQRINEILSNENLRRSLITQGFEQIKKYSWRQMAGETHKLYGSRF